jgi:4-amino-4-deoxy-L-arabinose transferase-like glycosyltransferase
MNHICKFIQKLTESRHGLLFILSFTLLIKGWLFIANIDTVINTDAVYYISAAKKLAMGQASQALDIYPNPSYPLLIALVHIFVQHWTIAARLTSYIFQALVTIPLYMLGKDLFDRRAAFWGCLVFTLLPESMRLTIGVFRDPPFCFLFILAVYFAQKAIRSKRVMHLMATAVLSWVSTLFRIEGITVFPVYLLVLGILGIIRPAERKAYLRLVAIWVISFVLLITAAALVVGPQGLIHNRYDEIVDHLDSILDFSFIDNFTRISAHLRQMEESAPYRQWGEHFASTARRFIAVIYLLGFLRMFIQVVLPVNIVPLIWGIKRSPLERRHIVVLSMAISYLIIIYLFFIRNDFLLKRFLFVPTVLACLWIGLGISRILDYAKIQRFGGIISVCIAVLLIIIPSGEFRSYFRKQDDLEIRVASWLAGQRDFGKMKIIYTDPKIAFYTGREISFRGEGDTMLYGRMDDRNYTGIEQVAAEKRADLIVVSVKLKRRTLVRDPEQYQEIKEFTGGGRSVLVYGSPNHFEGS